MKKCDVMVEFIFNNKEFLFCLVKLFCLNSYINTIKSTFLSVINHTK